MSRAVRLVVLVAVSVVGGALSSAAQTPRTGVVIRERVEVTRPAAPTAAARIADDCAAPVVAEAVFRGGGSWVSGAPIDGTLTVTTSCGTSVSGPLAGGFALSDIWPYHHGGADRYNYGGVDSVAVVRIPLRATESLVHSIVDMSGDGLPRDLGGSGGSVAFGCGYTYWGPNTCVAQSTYTHPGGEIALRRDITGAATTHTHAWPDTVACGTTTPLPVTLVKPDSTEGYVGPGVSQTFQLPGWTASTPGAFVYDGARGGQFVVPYADTRAGGLAYEAPACETLTAPTAATVWVTGLPGGTLLSDNIFVVLPPPDRFVVTAEPDTLDTGGRAWVTSVAFDGAHETYLHPETPVTLSVSPAGAGYLAWSRPYIPTVSGESITVPYDHWHGYFYAGARQGVYFYPTGPTPETDTPVTITASGGGLSGTGTVVRLGALRLDLAADPSALPNGGASRLYATVRGAGASAVPATSTLTFALADSSLGTLFRFSTQERGARLTGVSRSSAAGGDVFFERSCSGPPAPSGTAHITAAVDGWSDLVDDVSISVGTRVEGGSATMGQDTLLVWASPPSVAPGDSTTIRAMTPGAGGCAGGWGAVPIPDSTLMAVGVPSGYHGDLSYEGQRSTVFFDVPYVDLREGRIRFVVDGEIPCEDDTVEVHVEGGGLRGIGSLVIEGDTTSARGGGLARTGQCPVNWLTETRESIQEWHVENCPGFSQPLSETEKQAISLNYERILAEYLFGGMGWGRIEGYPRSYQDGVDGYLRWYIGDNGATSNYVSAIFESKLREVPPVANSGRDLNQVLDHINFLGDQYDAWVESPIHPANSVGTPILILASQNQWNGEAGWQVGYNSTLNDAVLNQANARGVAVVHVKIAEVGGYRYLMFQFMNQFSIVDPNNRLLQWVRRFGRVDLRGETFHVWYLPINFECGRVAATGANRASPPSPF